MTEQPNQHEALVAALVGDRQELYLTNAYFFNSVNNLAVLFRPMIDGLATAAAEAADTDARQLDAMRESIKAGMGEDAPIRDGHRWPCPAFYVGGDPEACDCGGGHGPGETVGGELGGE